MKAYLLSAAKEDAAPELNAGVSQVIITIGHAPGGAVQTMAITFGEGQGTVAGDTTGVVAVTWELLLWDGLLETILASGILNSVPYGRAIVIRTVAGILGFMDTLQLRITQKVGTPSMVGSIHVTLLIHERELDIFQGN